MLVFYRWIVIKYVGNVIYLKWWIFDLIIIFSLFPTPWHVVNDDDEDDDDDDVDNNNDDYKDVVIDVANENYDSSNLMVDAPES